MPLELLECATKCMSKGTGTPLFSNDDVIIPSMINFGYEEKDAYNYSTSACWEVIPLAVASDQNNLENINFIESLNKTLNENINNFDDLLNKYKNNILNQTKEVIGKITNIAYKKDFFMSLFINVDKNTDVVNAKYNNLGVLTVGISNAVNAILNIKKYVYEEKKYTLKEMIENTDEKFLSMLKNDNNKFGNDEEEIICLTNDLMSVCAEYIKEYNSCNDKKIKIGYSSPNYLSKGQTTRASLDGRKDFEPFNVHISCSKPIPYTELLNFASKLDYSGPIINGNVVDFSVTPDMINNNIKKFTTLFSSSIKKGVYQLQVNVVSSDTLIKAKKDPTLFPNLIVRVWGFSAYFNDLTEEYKDLLIERTRNYELAYK